MIACPEEIAYLKGYIDAGQVRCLAKKMGDSTYTKYLLHLLKSHGERG
jgi:glucose-1-phosphate thymidylyltransferase